MADWNDFRHKLTICQTYQIFKRLQRITECSVAFQPFAMYDVFMYKCIVVRCQKPNINHRF